MVSTIRKTRLNYCRLACLLGFTLLLGCAAGQRPEKTTIVVFDYMTEAGEAYKQGRWPEAEMYYQKVIRVIPEDHYAWFRLGNTQLRQGRLESAIYSYKQAVKRNPNHSKTHYNLGIAYTLSAKQSMKTSFDTMQDIDPGRVLVEGKIRALQKILGQAQGSSVIKETAESER